eukprot:7349622-Alexandrium_andersonii.AAC.1
MPLYVRAQILAPRPVETLIGHDHRRGALQCPRGRGRQDAQVRAVTGSPPDYSQDCPRPPER